jgi:type I restriction enzyme M protein
MVTGELRSKIDSLWEIFWTGGLTNPLDVIEQMTYLMFIHDLDDTDNLRAKESAMLGLPPTIRLWVTEYLATSQDLLPLHC